jgi:hypothetical protein
MLTTRRLLQLGFKLLFVGELNWYLCKNKFCLFPMNGAWAIGSDLGTLGIGPNGFIEIIETEDELIRYLKENNINI